MRSVFSRLFVWRRRLYREVRAVRSKRETVIVIPAGTPHWFSKIDGSLAYLVIRIDPGQIIALE
jgi:hypothetical protein